MKFKSMKTGHSSVNFNDSLLWISLLNVILIILESKTKIRKFRFISKNCQEKES